MFRDIREVIATNKAIGHHFFDRETLRFFGSRISRELVAGRYFVTSESDFYGTSRSYTIRVVNPRGEVDTVGTFGQYETLSQAKRAMRKLATKEGGE